MPETITDRPGRRLELVDTRPERTVIWTRHAPGQPGTELHLHREHTDVFACVEGELTLRVGTEDERVTLPAGSVAAVPPGVVHAFVNASQDDATWVGIHVPDGGFAGYLRGTGEGWDDHPPPADGGRSTADVEVVDDLAEGLARYGVEVVGSSPAGVDLRLADEFSPDGRS